MILSRPDPPESDSFVVPMADRKLQAARHSEIDRQAWLQKTLSVNDLRIYRSLARGIASNGRPSQGRDKCRQTDGIPFWCELAKIPCRGRHKPKSVMPLEAAGWGV